MLKWQIPSLGKILKVEIWDNHFNICNSYISREKKKKKSENMLINLLIVQSLQEKARIAH